MSVLKIAAYSGAGVKQGSDVYLSRDSIVVWLRNCELMNDDPVIVQTFQSLQKAVSELHYERG